jgi:hypothetical protein
LSTVRSGTFRRGHPVFRDLEPLVTLLGGLVIYHPIKDTWAVHLPHPRVIAGERTSLVWEIPTSASFRECRAAVAEMVEEITSG